MIFIIGVCISCIAGLIVVLSKKTIEGMSLSDFQKSNSYVNLLIGLPVCVCISMCKSINVKYDITWSSILVLVLYLALRIVSNISQTKLMKDRDTDINLVTVVLSTGCFLSLVLVGVTSVKVIIPIIVATLGVLIAVVDFRSLKFKISKRSLFLLILAYIASGSKPFMANYLLDYYSVVTLVILEYVNYAVAYTFMYRDGKFKKKTALAVLPLALLCVVTMVGTYYMYSSVIIYVITSFTSTVSVAVFSSLILKRKMKYQVFIGVILISVSVVVFKVLSGVS